MNQPDLFQRVVGLSREVVANTDETMFDRPTPCAEWNVRQLINHMAITMRFATAIVEQREPTEDRLATADVLGEDWQQNYSSATDAAVRAFGADGTMEREIDAPPGRVSGEFWVSFPTWDLYVHTWDLSKATGRPIERDDALTEPVLAWAEQIFGRPNDSQEFGQLVAVAAGAPAMDRLVAMFGRTP